MKEFINPDIGKCVVLKSSNGIFLIEARERREFVVASFIRESGRWSHGEYFKKLSDAETYYNKIT